MYMFVFFMINIFHFFFRCIRVAFTEIKMNPRVYVRIYKIFSQPDQRGVRCVCVCVCVCVWTGVCVCVCVCVCLCVYVLLFPFFLYLMKANDYASLSLF